MLLCLSDSKISPNKICFKLESTAFRRDSPLILESLGNLAYATIKTGDLDKAIEMYNGILRSQEGLNGKESQEYNETVGLLGYTLLLKQEYSQALTCLSIALKWQENNLGASHPSVLHTKESVKRADKKARGGASKWI